MTTFALPSSLLAFVSAWLPLCGFVLFGLVAASAALRLARRLAQSAPGDFWRKATRPLAGPARLGFALLALQLGREVAPPAAALPILGKIIALGWIATFAWLAVAFGGLFGLWLQRSYDLNSADNLAARKAFTRARLFRRLFGVLVAILSISAALMVFDATRGLGTSLLASAGLAGAVLGFSAQKLLGSVIAGVQIALAQPIRMDDVVVVEGEWGRVEEIGLTYVVVRIWDERRLILPTYYFLEKPVQNWTRTSARILGSAMLCVDYRARVPAIRAELERICREEAGDLWDGRVCSLQVTDAGPETLTLRALVSSSDSSRNWDLRCLVRERLAEFVREKMPEALPRTRVALVGTVGRENREGGDVAERD